VSFESLSNFVQYRYAIISKINGITGVAALSCTIAKNFLPWLLLFQIERKKFPFSDSKPALNFGVVGTSKKSS
jgi:hypothetical protein